VFVMVVFVFLFGLRPLYTSLCYWGPAVPKKNKKPIDFVVAIVHKPHNTL